MMGWLAEKLWFWEERRNYAEAKEAEAARRAFIEHLGSGIAEIGRGLEILTAVADERERCAQICDDHWKMNEGPTRQSPGWDSACILIAKAIRKGEG